MRSLLSKFAVASILASVGLWSVDAVAGDEATAPLPTVKGEGGIGVGGEGASISDASVANGKAIFNNGKGDTVPACMTCHGATGWGLDAMGAPRLARIGYPYVVKELSDLANGRRTPAGAGAVMVVFAGGLTEQERRDVAAYVSTLDGPPDLSDLGALKEGGTAIGERYLGEAIVKYGVYGKVSACSSCHGFNGRGAAPLFPVISQQKYVYLVNQLNSWRDGSRANDPYAMMRKMAANLTDADINNLATFLSAAPTTTGGDSIVPVTTK
jgi:cytochrome c553